MASRTSRRSPPRRSYLPGAASVQSTAARAWSGLRTAAGESGRPRRRFPRTTRWLRHVRLVGDQPFRTPRRAVPLAQPPQPLQDPAHSIGEQPDATDYGCGSHEQQPDIDGELPSPVPSDHGRARFGRASDGTVGGAPLAVPVDRDGVGGSGDRLASHAAIVRRMIWIGYGPAGRRAREDPGPSQAGR